MLQLLIFVIVFVIVMLLTIREERKFNQKWPPIDDDEFLRRCPRGTDRDTALKVRAIISEQLGVDYDRIYPGQSFVQDLGCH